MISSANSLRGVVRRYLLTFSYNGGKYSGVVKQSNTDITVQDAIEAVLEQAAHDRLVCSEDTACTADSITGSGRPLKRLGRLSVSSRTDRGVHALANTAHCDLALTSSDQPTTATLTLLCDYLNRKLLENDQHVRVLHMQPVADDFVSRHATARHYVYRLALLDQGNAYWTDLERIRRVEKRLMCTESHQASSTSKNLYPLAGFVSPFDAEFTTEVRGKFDLPLFEQALRMYNGQHDFSAFTTNSGRCQMLQSKQNPVKTVRTALQMDVACTHNILGLGDLDDLVPGHIDAYRMMHIEVQAGSFLYKMIRKMVGAALEVARHAIPLKQIKHMMSNPADFYDKQLTPIIKPNGLFLRNVEYAQLDSSPSSNSSAPPVSVFRFVGDEIGSSQMNKIYN